MLLFAGYTIGLSGTFKESEMIEARQCTIKNYICINNGASIEPIIEKVGQEIYRRDVSTDENLSSHPLLKDPLEDIFVEVQVPLIDRAPYQHKILKL